MARRSLRQTKEILKQDVQLETDHGLLPFKLIRSNGRRSMCITVQHSGMVEIAVPFYCPLTAVHDFIHKKARWIFEKLRQAAQNRQVIAGRRFEDGHDFPFLGRSFPLRVRSGATARAKIEFDGGAWQIVLPQREDQQSSKESMVRAALIKWYRHQAQEILGTRTFHYARIMDLYPERIAVRSFKRVWGNCDYRSKTVQFNWQIILSPIEVVDYVIVHELCHLVHPNHGVRFWKKVEKFKPDFRDHRKWLRQNHASLTLT